MNNKEKIDQFVTILNRASDAYYGGEDETLTNFEWDAMFDELVVLEKESHYIREDSPTQITSDSNSQKNTGEKERHEYAALSLAKTKKVEEVQDWVGDRDAWLSWKLDGCSVVCTYETDKTGVCTLTKILTRGNGEIGNVITYMKSALRGIPSQIDYTGRLIVRGEVTISYSDFETINDTLDDADDKYANPRNLVSGTLALDPARVEKVKERNATFHAFTIVHMDNPILSWGARLDILDRLGFITVEREKTTASNIPSLIENWTHKVDAGKMDIPVDGLVITYDDTDYAATGSITGHHATRGGLAFKWQDVSADSVLDHIEWSCAASTITPVAVFAPIQLEGTTVTRASLCNISELERLGIGEDKKTTLKIIKANKIIPKCISVVSTEGEFTIPEQCPVCQAKTEVAMSQNSDTKTLRCTNRECPAKHLKRFSRFVSKSGMDIDGLSIQTLKAFINQGFVHEYADIYHLARYSDQIIAMDGFGQKSFDNLLSAIQNRTNVEFVPFLFALCIPLIGVDAGKKIIAAIGTDGFFQRVESQQGFADIDGIGPERSNSILAWFQNADNQRLYQNLMKEISVKKALPQNFDQGKCAKKVFVITGNVSIFKNRNELKSYIEREGGAVTGSVSNKTDYLINNDVDSASSKNKKAKSLNIPILSEDSFVTMFGQS